MILTGYEDLRVIKTIHAIKAAFEELICEKDYSRIRVRELCERAKINKKTFYHYYETLDALLAEMQEELSAGYLERIRNLTLPDDLDQVNREFFLYSASQGLAYEKITCSRSYSAIRDQMIEEVTAKGWGRSPAYQALSCYEKKLVVCFVSNSVLQAYIQWVEDGKSLPLEEVIDMTNRIVLGGVQGFFA